MTVRLFIKRKTVRHKKSSRKNMPTPLLVSHPGKWYKVDSSPKKFGHCSSSLLEQNDPLGNPTNSRFPSPFHIGFDQGGLFPYLYSVDITHGINFSYTTTLTSQWIIQRNIDEMTLGSFASKRLLKSKRFIQLVVCFLSSRQGSEIENSQFVG